MHLSKNEVLRWTEVAALKTPCAAIRRLILLWALQQLFLAHAASLQESNTLGKEQNTKAKLYDRRTAGAVMAAKSLAYSRGAPCCHFPLQRD